MGTCRRRGDAVVVSKALELSVLGHSQGRACRKAARRFTTPLLPLVGGVSLEFVREDGVDVVGEIVDEVDDLLRATGASEELAELGVAG